MFPPRPVLTEEDLPDQSGKVVIITGAASGVGFELAKMLYAKNAVVYIAARSADRANNAIRELRSSVPVPANHVGRLEPMVVNLADLAAIKPAVDRFLSCESRLDVLIHNAGVMTPPAGSISVQKYELQLATNILGPFLLTRLLEGILTTTARANSATPSSNSSGARIVWLSSMVQSAYVKAGVDIDSKTGGPVLHKEQMKNYMQTKVGSILLGHEYAKRHGASGIISVVSSPPAY
jgi:retinol dehydrogenase 12